MERLQMSTVKKHVTLTEIEALAKQERYREALDECEKLLELFPCNLDVMRTRAYVFARSGDYNSALQDRKTILAKDGKQLNDYYLAANNALAIREFAQASVFLDELLSLGREQNESWFESAALFLQAYVQMELEVFKSALSCLDKAVDIDPDCSLPLPGIGYCTANQLRIEIESRISEEK